MAYYLDQRGFKEKEKPKESTRTLCVTECVITYDVSVRWHVSVQLSCWEDFLGLDIPSGSFELYMLYIYGYLSKYFSCAIWHHWRISGHAIDFQRISTGWEFFYVLQSPEAIQKE